MGIEWRTTEWRSCPRDRGEDVRTRTPPGPSFPQVKVPISDLSRTESYDHPRLRSEFPSPSSRTVGSLRQRTCGDRGVGDPGVNETEDEWTSEVRNPCEPWVCTPVRSPFSPPTPCTRLESLTSGGFTTGRRLGRGGLWGVPTGRWNGGQLGASGTGPWD